MLADTGIGSDLYNVVLLLHIVAMIVGFGGVLLNGIYAREGQKRPGPGGLAVAEANYAVSMGIAEKFIYAVPFLGVLLVIFGEWSWGDTWVWLSIVIYVVSLGISHSVVIPNARRINGLLGEMVSAGPPVGGPPPQVVQVAALGKKIGTASMVLHLGLVAILVLMIWKPA